MQVFFKTMIGRNFSAWLNAGCSLFDIHEAARRGFEAAVAPLEGDQFVVVIAEGKRLCSLEEAAAADYAIRAGGLAPAFPDGEERAACFMKRVPKLNCIHVVARRRPAPEA